MNIVAVIFASLKLALKIFSYFAERDKEKRALKKEGLKEVKDGIKSRDPNRINSGFSRINRIK